MSDVNIVVDLKKVLEFEMLYVIVFWRFDFGKYKMVKFMKVNDENEKDFRMLRFYLSGKIVYFNVIDEKVVSVWDVFMVMWEEDVVEDLVFVDVMNVGNLVVLLL